MTLALAAALLLGTALPVAAQQAQTTQSHAPAIAVGVAWYPEQWGEDRWATDLDTMKAMGFNTVRVGEFAWSRMEPEEGRFDFAWLDRAIAMAVTRGFAVVIGTPTAAPPAWLTQRYPDTLRVDENGMRAGHGGRRHFSFASKRYRDFARRIATELAKRYGSNPAVIGWQVDNEVGPPSWDAESIAAWHAFLKARYGTVNELNRRWATQYWSQFYNDFDQVPLRQTGQHNPGLLLDFRHFTTATWTDYVQNQVRAIRPLIRPGVWITTNTMFWNAGFDHFVMHRDLDMASWDNYIPDGRPDWVANGANHDLVWGYKRRNYWLMETQPGRVDWVPVNRALDPGQVRELAWQSIAHGSDGVLYWQWRPARNGQETYHGAILGQDGEPNPIAKEIAQVASDIGKAAPLLAGTSPVAKVAMLYSYDSRWAIDLQPHHRDFNPIREFTDFYRPFRVQAQGVHVLSPDADLAAYPLVVAPSLNVVTAEQGRALEAYVRGGGHLVLGPRSGMKDDANALWPQRQPGPLAALLGASVKQYYALDEAVRVKGAIAGKVSIWAEEIELEAKDVEVLATFIDPGGWLDRKPAIVARKVGRGSITYVGAWLDAEPMAALARALLADRRIAPLVADAHPDLEIAERAGARKRVLIVINHGREPHALALPAGAEPVGGDWADGKVPAHGVALFRIN